MRRMLLAFALATSCLLASAIAAPSAREACMSDYRKFCSGVSPGGGRIKQCLLAHRDALTPDCKAAIAAKAPTQKP